MAQADTHPWIDPIVQEVRAARDIIAARHDYDVGKIEPLAFCNWHFAIERGDRRDCRRRVSPSAVSYRSDFTTRDVSWRMNAGCAFTLSPAGAGLDCHRTWEALLLGSIPVVLRSPPGTRSGAGVPLCRSRCYERWRRRRPSRPGRR